MIQEWKLVFFKLKCLNKIMWDITILAIGKLKEKYWQAANDEYLKRLHPYARIKIEELKSEPFAKATQAKAQRVEAAKIKAYLQKKSSILVFLLSEEGEEMDSYILAETLKNINQPLIFVVGGSLGIDRELFEIYPKLSLSKLTFPHELARVILLEQLYRAMTIIKQKDYHY